MYIEMLKSIKSQRSTASNLNNAVKFFTQDEGIQHDNYDWAALSDESIRRLVANLTRTERSPQTINSYLSSLKGVAKLAAKNGVISKEMLSQILEIKSISGTHNKGGKAIAKLDIHKLIDRCLYEDSNKSLRDSAIMAVFYGTGIRRSSLAALQVANYIPSRSVIVAKGKGNVISDKPLNPRIKDMLEHWLDLRGRDAGPMFTRILKGGKVTKNAISEQAIYNIITERCKQFGLEHHSPHDLRHSFATELLKNNVDIKTVQEMMDHKQISTTEKYLHSSREDKENAVKNIFN